MAKVFSIFFCISLLTFGATSAKEYPSVGIMSVGCDIPNNINSMLEGEIRFGHYYGPDDYFSLPCPDLEIYRKVVKDSVNDGTYRVTFMDTNNKGTQIEVHDLTRKKFRYSKEQLEALNTKEGFIEFGRSSFKVGYKAAESLYKVKNVKERYLRHKTLGHLYWATIHFEDGVNSGYLYMVDSDHCVSLQIMLPKGMKKSLLKEALNLATEIRLQGHLLGENIRGEDNDS